MKKIFVTGASGFIGRHIVEQLRQAGHPVRVLVRSLAQRRIWADTVEIAVGDVQDAAAMMQAMAGCHTVYHLAGRAHALSEVRGDAAVYRSVNVHGTRNVLQGAVASGVHSFVLFSSVKAMGEGGRQCLDESFPAPPETPYGHSKLEAEQVTLDPGSHAGLHVACVRLPLVYGPGTQGNLLRMIAAIERGLFPPLPEVGNRRSMVHVTDVVRAAMLVSSAPAAHGQVYIVTDGQAYSTRRLYELICQALGKPVSRWQVPLWLLHGVGTLGDIIGRARGKRCPFDTDALDKLIGSAWYSAEKIHAELGYRPSITFPDALPELIAWYRKGKE